MDVFGLVVRHLILRLHGIWRGSGDKMICLMFQLLNCYPSISRKYQLIVEHRSKRQTCEWNKYRQEIFPDDLADIDMIWHGYCWFSENIIDVRKWISVNHWQCKHQNLFGTASQINKCIYNICQWDNMKSNLSKATTSNRKSKTLKKIYKLGKLEEMCKLIMAQVYWSENKNIILISKQGDFKVKQEKKAI